jgi:hypothetical protein
MNIGLRASGVVVAFLVASFLLAGLILFLAGLCYTAIVAVAPAWVAGLTTALGVLVIALATWAFGLAALKSASPRNASDSALAELVASQALAAIRSHPHLGALTALAAGFAIGASPELRQTLRKIL